MLGDGENRYEGRVGRLCGDEGAAKRWVPKSWGEDVLIVPYSLIAIIIRNYLHGEV